MNFERLRSIQRQAHNNELAPNDLVFELCATLLEESELAITDIVNSYEFECNWGCMGTTWAPYNIKGREFFEQLKIGNRTRIFVQVLGDKRAEASEGE